jgi:exosortase/archaeosortase family protein
LKKAWFHLALVVCIVLPILILVFLDYYNMEGYNYRFNPSTNSLEPWNNTYFSQNFSFDVTWKGRMFYLIFAWFLAIESAISWREIVDKKPRNRYLLAASLVCAMIPAIYVLATNFCGLDLALMKTGLNIGIPSLYPDNSPSDFLHLQWPISIEYIIFFIFFTGAIILAYKTSGLKMFSISLALLGAVGVTYMFDTLFPFGVFRPLQEMTLPTAATAAALFDILGYNVVLSYPSQVGNSLVPTLTVVAGQNVASVGIAWACAGVQSLLLYVLVILLFFKKVSISPFRKLLYFIVGLFGTFFANVLRVYAVIMTYLNFGNDAGMYFHNTYGELFGFSFIFMFILLIVCIERFTLVEKTKVIITKITANVGKAKKTLTSRLKGDTDTAPV